MQGASLNGGNTDGLSLEGRIDRQLIHIAKQETTMAKGIILDRLAGAMKTLGRREGKA